MSMTAKSAPQNILKGIPRARRRLIGKNALHESSTQTEETWEGMNHVQYGKPANIEHIQARKKRIANIPTNENKKRQSHDNSKVSQLQPRMQMPLSN